MDAQVLINMVNTKYPTNPKKNKNTALMVYPDGSGSIIKDAMENPYADGNAYFLFYDLNELIRHLKEPNMDAIISEMKDESKE